MVKLHQIKMIRDFYRSVRPIIVSGEDNVIRRSSKYKNGFIINIHGNHNRIEIAEECMLSDTQINMFGDNNVLMVDKLARFMGPCIITMEGNATLHIGENAGIRGVNFLLRGANLDVGKLCMFSNNIYLRNTDSHKVISLEDNQIMNPSKDIRLGEHVWIGQNATILKGVTVGDNAIIAMGAVVTKDVPANSIAAGNPSRIVKTGITWDY